MSAQLQEAWRLQAMDATQLAQVMAIEREAYAFPWTEGIFADCLRVGYSAWVVSDGEGQLLAYAVMSLAAGEAHILNLCVAPAHQRRGLARFLMKHLLMMARAGGASLMLLEVRRSNDAGRALYAGFGFRELGLRKAYYPAHDGREDAFVLGLDL
ncbi:MAG TPA: ribosomal protein S18-alanine N-acetyltransferase [Solimonas sp.]|nr:ribosomal protein S18-alanine N-acetyltransferase [Solimonas sp.]